MFFELIFKQASLIAIQLLIDVFCELKWDNHIAEGRKHNDYNVVSIDACVFWVCLLNHLNVENGGVQCLISLLKQKNIARL